MNRSATLRIINKLQKTINSSVSIKALTNLGLANTCGQNLLKDRFVSVVHTCREVSLEPPARYTTVSSHFHKHGVGWWSIQRGAGQRRTTDPGHFWVTSIWSIVQLIIRNIICNKSSSYHGFFLHKSNGIIEISLKAF